MWLRIIMRIHEFMRIMRKFNAGFTLVELLVVIAILGLLGSVILIQINKVRAKARDAEREKEIKTMQDALTIYVVNSKFFPPSVDGNDYSGILTSSDSVSQALMVADAITAIPKDPIDVDNYRYRYESPADRSTYTLRYYLETDTIPGKSAGEQIATP